MRWSITLKVFATFASGLVLAALCAAADIKRGEERSLFYYLNVHSSAGQWIEIDGTRYRNLRACNMTPKEDSFFRFIEAAKIVIFFTDGHDGSNGPGVMNIASLNDSKLLRISDRGTDTCATLYSPNVALDWDEQARTIRFQHEVNGREFKFLVDLDQMEIRETRTVSGVSDVLVSEPGQWIDKRSFTKRWRR